MPRAVRTTSIRNAGKITIEGAAPGEAVSAETVTPPKKNFWEEQEILNGAEGKNYVSYLYRLQPTMPGYAGQVAKFSEPVTIDQIAEQYGGYEYRISLHRGSKWICSDIFKVASPPKMMGVADPAMINGMPSINAGASGGDATAQIGQVLSFVNARLDKERAEKSNDPAYLASLDLVRESAKQAITAAYSANRNPAAESLQTSMMQMFMTSMSQMNSAMLTRLLTPPESVAKSGLNELKDLLALIPQLTGIKLPGGGGGRVDTWSAIGETLINAAPRMIEAGASFMDKYKGIASERTRQEELRFNTIMVSSGRAPTIPITPAAPPPVQFVPQNPVPPAPTAAFQTDPFPETTAQPAAAADIQPPNMEWMKRRIVELISRGMSGDDLVAFISGVDESMAQTLKVVSEDQIRQFFANDPILSHALQSPNFDQVLSEVVFYLHPETMTETAPV